MMDDLLKEVKLLRQDIAKLNERLVIYTKETENNLKIMSNRLNDRFDDLRREIKTKIRRVNKQNEEDAGK